jgi:pimeloyl-ACP methyl ester carboxylesterase
VTTLDHDDRGWGAPIVLIHGHPFDRRMWTPQLEGLSDEFRLVAPDLPGYGRSPVPDRDKTSMRELAEAVVDLMRALELDRPVVVGLSMGGLVAMEIGVGWPELAATTAAPVTAEEAGRRRAAADQIDDEGMLAVTLEMAGRLFGPAARRDPALVERVIAMMLHTPPGGAAAALRGRAERPDYTALLPHLQPPSLVIAGDHDPYAPEAVVEQLVASLPEPKVVRLPGAGHLPNLEAPEAFDAALRRFAAARLS